MTQKVYRRLSMNFLIKKIKLSSGQLISLSRSSGDRKNLNLELEKILNYSLSNKKIEFKNVQNSLL